jgi:cytochrome P450
MAAPGVPTAAVVLGGFDLTDLDNFAHGVPHDVFAEHRRVAPVLWHEPTEHTPDGDGFWSVATHAETLEVMRDAARYSSERGGNRPCGGTILPDQAIAGEVLNMMDDPRHARIRRLVSLGLTPRAVADLEVDLRRRMRAVFDDSVSDADVGTVDFVQIARELPLQAISILMGVPETDRHLLGRCVDHTFDFKDREYFEQTADVAADMATLYQYGADLIAEKRRCPADDMLSTVIHAELPEVEPPTLTEPELQLFFSLLYSAGAETTRSASAAGVLALAERPAQWHALRGEPGLVTTAVEEIVRWTAPSTYNRRTATVDTRLGGMPVAAGDKVVFWETSANRDERVFTRSMEFDVARDPNPHLGFGHGIHFCLGANLARLEVRIVLEEALAGFRTIDVAGPVEWTRSNKHTGLRHLPVRFTRATPETTADPTADPATRSTA